LVAGFWLLVETTKGAKQRENSGFLDPTVAAIAAWAKFKKKETGISTVFS